MKKLKQILAIAMVVMMGVVFMPMMPKMNGVAQAAAQPEISYMYPEYNKTTGTAYEQASSGIKEWKKGYVGGDTGIEYTVVQASDSDVTWNEGWYVLRNYYDIKGRITCNGDVHLILEDNRSLKATKGIECSGDNNSITIYGQENGTGKLNVSGETNFAGIGGKENNNGTNITINGGEITAKGGDVAAGIGGGKVGCGKDITINGGTVKATGGASGAGIGSGFLATGENITINGGKIIATGGASGAGIGGGGNGPANDITINDGTIYATGKVQAAGIGGGQHASGYNITINGAKTTATGGDSAAGIGGGRWGGGSNIAINGGKVTATCGMYCYTGIGAGASGTSSKIKAASDVTVRAGSNANNTIEIQHDADTDLATVTDFINKPYVTTDALWKKIVSSDCRYSIVTKGEGTSKEVILTIAPADGQTSGTLPDYVDQYRWPWGADKTITKVEIAPGVKAGESTAYMFSDCTEVKSMDISELDTSNVTNMSAMFDTCSSLTFLDLRSFDTSKVTDMSAMFFICEKLKTILVSDKFDTSGIANSDYMFHNCTNILGGAGTTYKSSNIDATYARIDGGPESETPGYFTGDIALKGKAQHDAGGTVASALTKSTARQPEAANTIIHVANTAYTAISKTNSDGKALGIGETGAALIKGIARQPEAADDLKTAAADIYKHINDASNDGQARGIGKVGAALMEGIACQPEAKDILKDIADKSAGKIKNIRSDKKAQATGEVYAGLIMATAIIPEKKSDFAAETRAILSNIYKKKCEDRALATAKIKGASLAAHASLDGEGAYKTIIDQAETYTLTEIDETDDGVIAISMGEMGARTLNTIVENDLSEEDGWSVIHAGIMTMVQGELSIAKSGAKARAMVETGTGLTEGVAEDEITGTALTTIESDAMEICQKINQSKSDDIAMAIGKLGAGELKALAYNPNESTNIKAEAETVISKISSMSSSKRAVGYGAVAGGMIEAKTRQPETKAKVEAELCYDAINKKATDASEGIGTMGAGSLEAIARQPESESTITAEMNLFICICADSNVEPTPTPTPTPTPSTEYTVTFDAQGHGSAPEAQKIAKGGKVKKPDDPVEKGHIFGGWFADRECTKAWDFDKDTVTKSMTLYAKWTEIIDIGKCELLLSTHEFAFNNKVQKPEITVDSEDDALKEGVDYTVEMKDSIDVGEYEVVVTGIGKYTGTLSDRYIIDPAAKAIKKVKGGKKKLIVKWKKSSKACRAQTTKFQIRYSTSKKFAKAKNAYAKPGASQKTIKGLKAHKKYYVKMRVIKIVDGQKYWSTWSKVKVNRAK